MNKGSLIHFTNYNVWANTKLAGFILEAGEEKSDVSQNSSFSSIRKTLYHIWDAETIWIKRLQGDSFTDWPSKNFNGTLKAACESFLKNSENFVLYAKEKSETELNSAVTYKTLDGNEFSNITSYIIMHVMNHSTFHRGQIITLLRNTGFDKFSSTDYITFCRL